jgi:hypothetical protein
MLTGRAKSFQFFLILGNSSNLIFDKSKTMSDEEILKTEKNLIDFSMQISYFFEWDCTSADLQTFRNLPKKQFRLRFHQKKICLNFAERINHLWLLHIHMCEKRPPCEKDWKVGKLYYS